MLAGARVIPQYASGLSLKISVIAGVTASPAKLFSMITAIVA